MFVSAADDHHPPRQAAQKMDRAGTAEGRYTDVRARFDSGSSGQGIDLSKQTYHPERGDIVHLNLSPSAGHELTGPHYALVISTARFSKATGFVIVVPGRPNITPIRGSTRSNSW